MSYRPEDYISELELRLPNLSCLSLNVSLVKFKISKGCPLVHTDNQQRHHYTRGRAYLKRSERVIVSLCHSKDR